MFEELFAQKRVSPARLMAYGFESIEDGYRYTCPILDGEFSLLVVLDRFGNPDTSLYECDTGEEYVLYKTTAEGCYVGRVREAVAEVLCEIAETCCDGAMFRQGQTEELLRHAAEVYGTEAEFPWGMSPPATAVLRRVDSEKWYAIIMTIPQSKLGLPSDQPAEVMNLHAEPETVAALLTRDEVYPAWHMNKKSWYTVILDGSVENEALFLWLAESYRLAGKSAKGTPKKRKTNGV